jgi:aldehyde dehydrogenase (NAD+)/betaine-aldehyde dehydrogenase
MPGPQDVRLHRQFFIGGAWVDPAGGERIEVTNAGTEQVAGQVPAGTAADVDAAVAAARKGFERWSRSTPAERGDALDQIAAGLRGAQEELAELIAAEVGSPLRMARQVQVGLPIHTFTSMAARVREFQFEETVGNSRVVREPVGVVGAITPWNYPLHQICCKVAPAIAAGCAIVLKPSEVTPLNAFLFAELIEESDLPAGVFNLVCGTGEVVGEAIAGHPGVDMVSFTGSTRAGRRVSELAAQTVKSVTLELGGKSPNVILEDADLATAVADGVAKCFQNAGQTCSALTRMLVPRVKLAEAEAIAKATAEQKYLPGDPFEAGTRLGPLVSEQQRERVQGYIRKGVAEGARLLTGGAEPPEGLDRGYYVRPTVFSDVNNSMTIAREEIFGPVLTIIPYDSEDEAVAIANDTPYGLAAGVWSGSEEHATKIARRLRAGQIEVNGGAFNPEAPFGGFKQSGHGRENGPHAIDEYLAYKAIQT